MSSHKKLFMDFPSKETLEKRMKIMNISMVVIPVVLFIFFEVIAYQGYTPPDSEIQGFFHGYSFLWTCIGTTVLYLTIVSCARLVYFSLGYDLPDKDSLYNNKLDPKKGYTDAMIRENNFSIAGMVSFSTGVILLVVFLVQWVLGALWYWTPIAILLPVAVATPVVLVLVTRKINRKKKLEQIEIMNRLKGKW